MFKKFFIAALLGVFILALSGCNPSPVTIPCVNSNTQYIYFGEYPQTIASVAAIDDMGTVVDVDGYYTSSFDGERYAKLTASAFQAGGLFTDGSDVFDGNTYYFKVEPIRWRLLEQNSGINKLVTELVLDAKRFNDDDNIWETSEIRDWLNVSFYDQAFSHSEQSLILDTVLDNQGTSNYSNTQNNTTDEVFLLSYDDSVNTNYRFDASHINYDCERIAISSDYARAAGVTVGAATLNYGATFYWLRSNGGGEALGTYGGKQGAVWFDAYVDHEYMGVRPAIELDSIKPYIVIENYVVFGEYPQTLADKGLTSTMSLTPDIDGYYLNSTNNERYAKVISSPYSSSYSFSTGDGIAGAIEYYFLVEPIKWKVLEDTGSQMYLMADLSLDVMVFDSAGYNDWVTSSIRLWLNDYFYEVAFNIFEQSIIMTTSVSPPATTGTTAGVTTMDKVFIISGADAIEVAYGFNIDPNIQDLERKGYTSDYSLARGIICPDNINTYYAHSPWWLRTPGTSQHSVLFTTEFGEVITDIGVLEDAIGVRPAIIINTT